MALFDLSKADQSAYYLNQIFGLVGTILPYDSGPLLFSMIFQVLNTMALTVGTLMVVYITVVGVMQTAHDGEFMGKKWSGLWIPIRMVFGIVALIPTKTGYAAIQIIVMWVIIQGVGAADKLWTTVLKYQAVTGSIYQQIDVSTINQTLIQQQMRGLFDGLTCQATMRINQKPVEMITGSGATSFYCLTHSGDSFCTDTDSLRLNITASPTYGIGPDSQCAKLEYCDKSVYCSGSGEGAGNSELCNLTCDEQQKILQTIVTTYGSQIALKLAQTDYQYVYFHETAGAKAPDFVRAYCDAKGLTPEQCCSVPPPAPFGTAPPEDKCALRTLLPSSYISPAPNYVRDNTYGNEVTIKTLYFPYAMQPYVNSSDFIKAASKAYAAAMAASVNEYFRNRMSSTTLSNWQAEAEDYGWILAGSYYYKMANSNKQNIKALSPPLTVTKGNLPSASYRNNYQTADILISAMDDSAGSQTNNPTKSLPSGFGSVISGTTGATASSLLATFMSNLSNNSCTGSDCSGGNANPLSSIATFGYQLMITAQLLFAAVLAASFFITLAGTINPMVLGTGLTLNPVGEAIKSAISVVGPFITLLISALFTEGALLGIYVPLIPYIVFTMGAIGWMIGCIEAMVASPIIALGILSPGGQHEVLGRAEQAVMLLFNLFLRPTLMIVGLMAAMLMSIVVVRMINSGFLAITSQIISAPGLFEEILFIAAYISLIVTALNKTFSLIYHIPEKITTWIGGTAVSYGEGEALGEVKRGVESAAGGAAGAGKQSGAAAVASVESMAKANKAKEVDDNKTKLTGG
jgi:hypothetical protein